MFPGSLGSLQSLHLAQLRPMGLEFPDWVVRKFRDWGLGTKALLLFSMIVVVLLFHVQ